ncbi:MAG: bifunctional folylpolyglutamate synthase/dihydrofolate synthase [Pirellulaceae bacterium]|nr:bifunctional folylpolyglutamate synthase/dihydrofolate synthase [Pirellulaceae bacterium]
MARSPDIVDHDSALAYLFGRIDYERADRFPSGSHGLSLDRMRELAFRLGDPQQRFPVVHVAGTKGKGSTSGMIAAVLTASGYRTGLYTSPHVDCVEERMQIDGRRCGADEFVDLIRRIRPVVDALDGEYEVRGEGKPGPTYFEITTAAALLHFVRHQVEVAVLEVGLGGRLDSTNICQPEVAVITSISFDHMRQLGNTLALIAGEKAGIIKPGVPVVTGVTEPESLDVIRQTALRHDCECYRAGRHFDHRYGGTHPPTWESASPAVWPHGWSEFDYWEDTASGRYELEGLRTGLLGRHQAANAAVAVATLVRLRERGWRAEEAAIREGLLRVDMPARTEVLQRRPMVILDAAHNVASARALIDVIRETCPRTAAGRRILVFAASQDKDVAAMLRLLLAEFDVAILTRFLNNPRAADPDVLLQIAEQIAADKGGDSCRLITRDNSTEAWDLARSLAADDDVICVAGSFFLASELRSLIPQQFQNP